MNPIVLTVLTLACGLAGCAPGARSDVSVRINAITSSTAREQMEELLAIGPRYSGDEAQTANSIAFLKAKLESFGYRVHEEPCGLEIDGVPQRNVIAELTGQREPNLVCELGAHYDTVPGSPGADDNGSGVVGVLEVARVLSDATVGKTVRFCFFAAEELGLHGSTAHVEQLAESDRVVEGTIVLEMIGYASSEEGSQEAPIRIPLIASLPYTGDFICVVGNFSSGGLGNVYEYAADAYEPDLEYYSANRIGGFFADAARSDHFPYWEAGRTAIMLTDTANFRNPNYHQETDTIDTLDFEFLARTTRATAAALLHWAQ